MAHYAFINDENIVVEVIVGVDETETVNGITGTAGWETFYETQRPGLICRRTSYHGNIRKNYAGIGYTFDPVRDAFIAPKPYLSWILNEETCRWDPPIPYPNDGGRYQWDEEGQQWAPASL